MYDLLEVEVLQTEKEVPEEPFTVLLRQARYLGLVRHVGLFHNLEGIGEGEVRERVKRWANSVHRVNAIESWSIKEFSEHHQNFLKS